MMLMVFGTQIESKRIFIVQRKIAYSAFIAGFLVSIINFVSLLSEFSIMESLLRPAVFLIFIISFLTLLTGIKDFQWLRMSQAAMAFIMGLIAILDVYNSIHGLGMIMLSIFLAFKYDFLKKRLLLKIVLTMIVVFALVMISAQRDYQDSGVMSGLNAIIYLAVFVMVTYIIYQDEITAYIRRNREAESTILVLRDERQKLAEQLEELDRKIVELIEPVDLFKMGLTKKEMEVLEALILYRETEQQLAERLGMSFHTLKNHFRHIRDKLGVDKREDIIEMCRNNFV